MATECLVAGCCRHFDCFKPINDRLGYAAGDIVRQEVGRRLMTLARGVSIAGRIGGDEFVVAQFRSGGTGRPLTSGERIVRDLSASNLCGR